MKALAGPGVAVANPVASSAVAASAIGSFILESSIRDSKMQARVAAGKGAKVQRRRLLVYVGFREGRVGRMLARRTEEMVARRQQVRYAFAPPVAGLAQR